MMPIQLLLAVVLASFVAPRPAAPVKWTFTSTDLHDGRVRIDLTAALEPGWHVYATQLPSNDGPLPTVIAFTPDSNYELAGALIEPEPEKQEDPNFGMVLHFHSEVVTFSQTILRKGTGAITVSGEVEYMTCNDKTCLPPVKVPFTVVVPELAP